MGYDCFYRLETVQECLALDRARGRRVGQALPLVKSKEQRRALKFLRDTLAYDPDEGPPHSRASALYMRGFKQRVAGELIRLRREERPDMQTLTLLPVGWELAPELLSPYEFLRRIKRIKNYLERPEFRKATGFFFGALDLEYRERRDLVDPHIHAAVSGDYVEIIKEKWKSKAAFQPRHSSAKPIQFNTIREPAAALTYPLKNALTYRDSIVGKGQNLTDGRKTFHMPEPVSSLILSTLNNMRVTDTFILSGCRVEGGRLVVTKDH